MKDKWKKMLYKLMFSAYVVLFCFVAGEIGVRVFYKHFADFNMEMWRYACEIKKPLPYDKLPFHHMPGKQGHYYGVTIKTNSLGFRDYEYSIDKPGNKKRIVLLGDSFTLGWGVPFEDTFAKQLETMLNERESNHEVINMGVGNYNSTMEVELFKLKGLQLKPDMVVLMFFVNDTEAIPRRKSGFAYAAVKHSYFVSFMTGRFIKLRSRFVRRLQWSDYYQSLYSAGNSQNVNLNRDSIMELAQLCRENKIELLIVHIPELRSFTEYRFSEATEYIRSVAEEAAAPFLDLFGALAGHEPQSLWVSPEDPHANAKANTIIAERLSGSILENSRVLQLN